MTRIWGLDLLRAIAVIAVLISHVAQHSNEYFLQKLLPIGPTLGVEIFFVLSGFLIGQILVKLLYQNDFALSDGLAFMKRRWYRTLPNYYLFLIIMLVLQWEVGKHHIFSFIFFMQNPLSKPVDGFYGVTWSLTIEEIFYIGFPLMLIALGKFFKDPSTKLLLALSLFIVLPFVLRFYLFLDPESLSTPADHRKAALVRLDSIAYGVFWAYIKLRHENLWKNISNQGLLLLIPFWYLFMFNVYPKFSLSDWQLIYFPLCSITLSLTLPYFDSIKNYIGLLAKPISFIAKISYSLYLCHIPTIIVSNHYLNIKSLLTGQALNTFYILASILVAWVVHVVWERPTTNIRQT